RDPNRTGAIPVDLLEANAASVAAEEWPPEVTAAFELAHLGFYCQAPHEVQRHAKQLAEEFGVVSIAELTDYADRAPISVAGIVTSLRVRTTKKSEQMAWVVLSDGTGGLECGSFRRSTRSSMAPACWATARSSWPAGGW